MRIYEKALAEDLNLGIGTAQVQNPGGGVLNGTQISLTTLSLAGKNGTKTTASWTPGQVTPGLSVSTLVSVPGAELGDVVLPALNVALGGLILAAAVDSSGVVRVTLANVTAAAITVPAVTISLLVFRTR